MRARCSGVNPLSMCGQSCFVVRCSIVNWFTWYIVWRRSVLWSVISFMRSGDGLDVSGVGRVSGMCGAGRLLEVLVAVVVLLRLA